MPLATPRLPEARGQRSPALNWGPPAFLDCTGTGGAALGWAASHGGVAARLEGLRVR